MDNLQQNTKKRNRTYPVVPLKDFVMFPNSLYPLLVGREKSIKAAEKAFAKGKHLFLVMQKEQEKDEISGSDLNKIGTVVKILHYLKLPNGLIKILVEGKHRAKIVAVDEKNEYISAKVSQIEENNTLPKSSFNWLEHLKVVFKKFVEYNSELPEELYFHLEALNDPVRIIDFVALHMPGSSDKKQEILEEAFLTKRLEKVVLLSNEALTVLEVEKEIEERVKDNLLDHQRQVILQEQMRVIKEELGEDADYRDDELMVRINKGGLSKEAREKAVHEYKRLQQIPSFSPEAGVIKNYIDWLVELPWRKRTKDTLDLAKARRILDRDHYGLKKVKERILEHLAVLQMRKKKSQGTILCFAGPPGVGKTSLASSIAKTLGRNFVRMSLGGVRDEAEIRGHRRTYVAAMPGRIIQGIKKAGSKNPVFLLDEIDKMSTDFRGDPSSALLEVLDPEQNRTFNDHFLETDFDLSEIFFITTANDVSQIPWALQDRMEIIELAGYIEAEKKEIARRHLIPKQAKKHGFKRKDIVFADEAIETVINGYTREAGVRQLERNIATLFRKSAVKYLEGKLEIPFTVDKNIVEELLGAPRYKDSAIGAKPRAGVVNGLAWTLSGGDIIKIEVIHLPSGKEKIHMTGKLGEVMKESAEIALTYIKSILPGFGLKCDYFENKTVHIHLPEGSVPKDGPSAGITLATALLSAVLKKSFPADVAMTGEITLLGDVLPIGGLKEKIMAAKRYGIKKIILPEGNRADWHVLEDYLKKSAEFIFVDNYKRIAETFFADLSK